MMAKNEFREIVSVLKLANLKWGNWGTGILNKFPKARELMEKLWFEFW